MTALPAPLPLSSSASSGSVHRYGAHVVSWSPTGGHPVLWVSALAKHEVGQAIRGGVPVCFPWFAPGRSQDMEPAHGFARITQWQVQESDSQDVARFRLTHDDVDASFRSQFPHEFVADFAVDMGDSLTMSMTVTNTGDSTFDYELALHTYLTVGDSREISIGGLEGATYWDKVTEREETQSGEVTLSGETDRVYYSQDAVAVKDPVLKRTITVSKSGSANTVVWNPWAEKAAPLTDFADDEWQRMVCVETANVLDNAVVLEPGQSHTLVQELSVSSAF